MATNPISVKDPTPNTQKEWFDFFIGKVTDTVHRQAEKSEPREVAGEIGDWFNSLIEGVYEEVTMVSQARFQKAFTQTMVGVDYLSRITANKVNVLKVAMYAASDKIYVWAEINDDDIKTDDRLIEIEEQINTIYYEKANMTIQTMIVKKGDNLAIPVHYKQVH